MRRFSVSNWSAWAPSLVDQSAWLAWLAAPRALPLTGVPALAEMPAMMRRRVERLGRIALQAAYWSQADSDACPVIFASRYGDMSRAVELLGQLVREESLSPTAFSMSVHNAISALFSIARQDTGAYTAIAAGDETTEAAFMEALGLLVDGARAVLVVVYDEQLPVPYDVFDVPDRFPRAWACRVTLADDPIGHAANSFSLELCEAVNRTEADTPSDILPTDLAALRFLTGSAGHSYEHAAQSRIWRWQRHD